MFRTQLSRSLLSRNFFVTKVFGLGTPHMLQFISPHAYEFVIEDASLPLTHNQAG